MSNQVHIDESRSDVVIGALVVCTVLSTLSFVARIWGRTLSAVKLGWDDLLMTLALIGCWAITADNIVGLHFGFGRHVEFITPTQRKNYVITLFLFFILQTFTTLFIKMAILMLYRRLFTTETFHRTTNIVGAVIIADSLAILLGFCFYCIPLVRFWDHSIAGKCVNRPLFTMLGSLTLLLTDLMLYIMPMPVIWKLKMTTRRKIETTIVFTLGGFVCLTRIVQLVVTSKLDFEDVTWSNVEAAIWNVVESHIGCLAANTLLMGPLFTRLLRWLNIAGFLGAATHGESHKKLSAHYAVATHCNSDHKFRRMEDDNSVSTLVRTVPPCTGDGVPDSLALNDINRLGMGRIMVRTDMEQEYREPRNQTNS